MIGADRFNEPCITYGQMNLLFNIRNLWREAATWTRSYLISKYAGLDITEDIFNRLYQIPLEFGNVLTLILGNQAATQYVQFISAQVVLTKEIIDAQMAGNIDLVNEKVQQLYQSLEERIKYMSEVNPFWNEAVIRSLIYTYYQYTLDEITTLLSGDYKTNIDIYDRLLHHSDSIGDYFTEGLFNYLNYSAPTSV